MTQYHDDFALFLMDTRQQSLIHHLLVSASYLELADNKNYLNILEDGTISYLPANKQTPYGDNYSAPGRMKGRPAKIMRSLIPPALLPLFTDSDFEDFANSVKAYAGRNHATFSIVTAHDIPYWYHEDQYAHNINTGSLAHSCMRYPDSQRFVEMYTLLGDSVSLLILTHDTTGHLLGRALLWHTDDGTTYMDRAYGSDATRTRFHAYAREQGWWKRARDTYDTTREFIDPDGEHQTRTITIPLNTFPTDGFPFMDTFQFLNAKTHTLSNSSRNTHVQLADTGGRFVVRDPFYTDAPPTNRYSLIETLQDIWNATPVQPSLELPASPTPPPPPSRGIFTYQALTNPYRDYPALTAFGPYYISYPPTITEENQDAS